MICVSVAAASAAEALAQLGSAPMGEVRLDLVPMPEAELTRLFADGRPFIATCRPGPADRTEALEAAIRAGARYVDLELDGDEAFRERLVAAARAAGCGVILSFHDFGGTPSRAELDVLIQRGLGLGADMVKVACTVQAPAEAARLLGLLDGDRPLAVVGMGPAGRIVRLVAPLLGSPLAFAAPVGGMATAPGQLDLGEMERFLATLEALGEAP